MSLLDLLKLPILGVLFVRVVTSLKATLVLRSPLASRQSLAVRRCHKCSAANKLVRTLFLCPHNTNNSTTRQIFLWTSKPGGLSQLLFIEALTRNETHIRHQITSVLRPPKVEKPSISCGFWEQNIGQNKGLLSQQIRFWGIKNNVFDDYLVRFWGRLELQKETVQSLKANKQPGSFHKKGIPKQAQSRSSNANATLGQKRAPQKG